MILKTGMYKDMTLHCKTDNRIDVRVDFKTDIYYPIVNNKSVYKDYDVSFPLLTAINISVSGICFKSRIPLNKGDFISFLLKINNYPSFWCLAEVKWVEARKEIFIAGCKFYLLKEEHINTIRNYVKSEVVK